jgi:subtilisin family serine protease
VLLDPRLTPASAEEIVAELTNRNVALLEFFGNPAATKKLITDTTSPDRKADFSRAPMSPRALLDQFVILTFDTTRQAEQAYEKLKANTLVLAIERNGVGSFSVTPSDCYFGDPHAPPCQSTPAGHENYQWGLNKLEFPRAWDRVRGQAYVAAIDSGVPWTSQSTHPDLQRSLRPLFSYNVIPGYSVTDLDDNFFGGKGHGTHVLGIIAATPEYATSTSLFVGNTNSGVAGGCWNCSVAMIKFGGFVNQYADTIAKAVDRGMQVVNMSWGDDNLNASTIPPAFTSCAASDYQSACLAIAYAVERDVVLVGAAGNKLRNRIQFPAQHSSVVSVGGIEADSSFWDVALVEPLAEPGSNYGSGLTIAAPAKEILSTVYPSANWSTDAHCGDSYGPPIASSIGYGGCTGTSMSAPHITALLGLIRSADPLLNRTESKNILTRSATKCTGSNSDRCGPGFPDAVKAVADALGGPAVINRVTPLFSFYSSIAKNHFYTSVPQMALAALISGGLLPQPSSGSAVQYGQIGLSIPGYPSFPNAFSPAPPATAIASIFTTHRNPISGQSDLAPLYRLSFRCGDQTEPLPACTPGHVTYNAAHISHFYETDANGVKTMTGKDVNGLKLTGYPNGAGYQLDGIEGFVYPRTQTQPPGTVKLCRKYDATRDDWVLFPGVGSGGTDCSSTSDGYTGGDYSDAIPGADWLGWVYHVKGSATVCINNVSCRAVAFLPLILDD